MLLANCDRQQQSEMLYCGRQVGHMQGAFCLSFKSRVPISYFLAEQHGIFSLWTNHFHRQCSSLLW